MKNPNASKNLFASKNPVIGFTLLTKPTMTAEPKCDQFGIMELVMSDDGKYTYTNFDNTQGPLEIMKKTLKSGSTPLDFYLFGIAGCEVWGEKFQFFASKSTLICFACDLRETDALAGLIPVIHKAKEQFPKTGSLLLLTNSEHYEPNTLNPESLQQFCQQEGVEGWKVLTQDSTKDVLLQKARDCLAASTEVKAETSVLTI